MTETGREDPIPKALNGIRDLYAGTLATHGTSSKSVGWKDESTHMLRFERLARIVDDGTAGFTVNDWGCGYGAMYGYLDSRFGPRLTAYTGYDISPEMLEAASRTVLSPRARFALGGEVTEDADYVFVSGTFNVKLEAADADWDQYVKEQLARLYARSRRGLAFNLLTSYVDWTEAHLFYADPRDYFDFCTRQLSRFVTLVHDSVLYEWTILVHREPHA